MSAGKFKDEAKDKKKQRAVKIAEILTKTYPDATCSLDHNSSFELLISTILAAQCTDIKVNEVTPALFKKYPTPKAFAEAELSDLEIIIKPTGFFRNKAKSIKNCSAALVQNHKGQVPDSMEELTKLPGVGRKTANVVRGNCFGYPAIIVDTHVTRISQKLELSFNSTPEKIEIDLMEILPEKLWTNFCNCLVFHGRACCNARKPDCDNCPIRKYCPVPEE